ncbi:hypothetical protein LR48_Vigan02g193700 [Vigna angularis]|uniref:Uncharacterized protein n=1 Tax=Phaseolus angularis TaxID=3914 RepID=A0A0L9TZE3_PHAAN|nr:hypothetical protein LR48_Vigan02g193700 [Vigna angularis]
MEGRIDTLEGRVNTVERWASEQKRELTEWRRNIQEMILEDQNQERDTKGREKSLDRPRRGWKEEFLQDNKKGKKEVKKGRDAVKDSLQNIKKAKKFYEEGEYLANDEEKKKRETNISEEGNVVTITSGSRVPKSVVLSVDGFAGIRGQDRREENICEVEGNDENYDGDIGVAAAEKVAEVAAVRVDNVTNVGRENTSGEDHDGKVVTLASPSKVAKAVVFSEDRVVGCGGYVKTVKKGEELLRSGVKTVVSGSDPAVVWVSMGASTRAVTDPFPEITEEKIQKETSGMEAVQTVSEANYNTCAPQCKRSQVRKQYRTVIWSRGILEKEQFLLMEEKESIILSYKPPPKPSYLNWRTIASGLLSYDNMMMKRSHEIKLNGSNLEDKVVMQQGVMIGYNGFKIKGRRNERAIKRERLLTVS